MLIYDDIFSKDEIQRLIDFYEDQPISNERRHDNGTLQRVVKSTDYNIKDSVPYNIIHDKLEALIGPHTFSGGHHVDSHLPYELHVDTVRHFQSKEGVFVASDGQSGYGVLIPLIEHPEFKTLFFDHYIDDLQFGWKTLHYEDRSNILPDNVISMLTHQTPEELEKIKYLPLDGVADWKLGRVVTWPRNQLHCSSDFRKSGLTKQAVVVWVTTK